MDVLIWDDEVAHHVEDVVLAESELRLLASALAKLPVVGRELAVDAGDERACRDRDLASRRLYYADYPHGGEFSFPFGFGLRFHA